MFGFVKEFLLIGQVSSGLGKIVQNFCHTDYIGQLSIRDRNLLAENAIKRVARLRGKSFTSIDESVFDDLMVTGFLLIAQEKGPRNVIDHQVVLMGLMGYIKASLAQSGNISPILLKEAMAYIETYRMSDSEEVIESKNIIISCPKCLSKFRVPTHKKIEVICRQCHHKWVEAT